MHHLMIMVNSAEQTVYFKSIWTIINFEFLCTKQNEYFCHISQTSSTILKISVFDLTLFW